MAEEGLLEVELRRRVCLVRSNWSEPRPLRVPIWARREVRRAVGRRRVAARLGCEDLIRAGGGGIGVLVSRAIVLRTMRLTGMWRSEDGGIEDRTSLVNGSRFV